MRTLAEHPPEGWEAELLSSHVVGSPWAKWRAYRRARTSLSRILRDPKQRPDVVHLHTAADWSWWRKRRFAKMAHKAGVANVVHIHSGKFDSWLGGYNSKRARKMIADTRKWDAQIVALSHDWEEKLTPYLGNIRSINNPLHPIFTSKSIQRDTHHLLLLGRNDPVKGHLFAEEIGKSLRKDFPELQLTMTGITSTKNEWVSALGWVSEELKLDLLQKSTLLLLPSQYEGQPMVVIEALACGLSVVAHEHLTSLPSEVIRAGAKVEDWCDVIRNFLTNPTSLDFDSSRYEISQISNQWAECYTSFKAR